MQGQIIRIIIISIVGLLLMMVLQPFIYDQGFIAVDSDWSDINNYYTTAAIVVFAASVAATIIWCVLGVVVPYEIDKVLQYQLVWWLLLLLPILGIGVGLFILNIPLDNQDVTLNISATILFFFNGVIWLYWLPTATSSLGKFRNLPPGANLINNIFGG